MNELQRSTHLNVGTAPGELGGERPQIDAVFSAERGGAEAVLFVMVNPAQAHAEHVVRLLRRAGISGRRQMGEFDLCYRAIGHAAAMRFGRPQIFCSGGCTPILGGSVIPEFRLGNDAGML